MTLLSEYLETYGRDREITAGYEYQLSYAINRFTMHLGRPSELADLNRDAVNGWLQAEHRDGQIGARSRNNVRRSIMTLWADAAEDGMVDPPHRIRPVKVPEKIPEAWTFEEVKTVAEGAGELPGCLANGVPRSLYFQTLIWFAFETGLRRRDVLHFDIRMLRGNFGSIVQHKTGEMHTFGITEETARDLRKISQMLESRGDKDHHFPLRLPGCLNTLYYWIGQARKIAGVDVNTRNRSMQHLRRSGATQVDIESPGSATDYLGHRSGPALARKSYVDRRLTGRLVTPARNRKCQQRKI